MFASRSDCLLESVLASAPPSASNRLVRVRQISKHFKVRSALGGQTKRLQAVDGVNLDIIRGETLSLVGESGCGKSTLGRLILNLLTPTSGDVVFDNVNITSLPEREMRGLRRRMQIIFQNPYSSLNPRMRIADILAEPLVTHGVARDRAELRDMAAVLLASVGLGAEALDRFPHEFSGGQRQRIGIARAIALRPSLIVCDEPLSALDVSIRSQVINLLCALKREMDLTYLFISHDLSVVRYISDRICVMYLGKIVELGTAKEVFGNPLHPYTQSLIEAAPIANPHLRDRPRALLQGEIPSPIDPPSGCRFRTRCTLAQEICARREPTPPKGYLHGAACHFAAGES